MESVRLTEEDVMDRTKWKRDIQNHSGDPEWREKLEQKKIENAKEIFETPTTIR